MPCSASGVSGEEVGSRKTASKFFARSVRETIAPRTVPASSAAAMTPPSWIAVLISGVKSFQKPRTSSGMVRLHERSGDGALHEPNVSKRGLWIERLIKLRPRAGEVKERRKASTLADLPIN